LELQINVDTRGAEQIDNNRWERAGFEFFNFRIPRNVNKEPEWRDWWMQWPLGEFCEAIGSTGFNWRRRTSETKFAVHSIRLPLARAVRPIETHTPKQAVASFVNTMVGGLTVGDWAKNPAFALKEGMLRIGSGLADIDEKLWSPFHKAIEKGASESGKKLEELAAKFETPFEKALQQMRQLDSVKDRISSDASGVTIDNPVTLDDSGDSGRNDKTLAVAKVLSMIVVS